MIIESGEPRRSSKRVKVESQDDLNPQVDPTDLKKLSDDELDLLVRAGDADAVVEMARRLEIPSESIDKQSVSSEESKEAPSSPKPKRVPRARPKRARNSIKRFQRNMKKSQVIKNEFELESKTTKVHVTSSSKLENSFDTMR